MNFVDMAKPSDGDKKRSPARTSLSPMKRQMRSRANRKELAALVNKVVRHEKNAAEHRGDKDAITRARELTQYVAACLAIVQPYEVNEETGGFRAREGGDKEEFWEWMKHMKDLLALRLPYERPRLASITLKEERPEDTAPVHTVLELRATMVRKGIPVDHLAERKLMLDHELLEDSKASK